MKNGIENNLCRFAPQMYSVLKELQESASYWSDYDVPLGIVDRINNVLEKVENLQKTDTIKTTFDHYYCRKVGTYEKEYDLEKDDDCGGSFYENKRCNMKDRKEYQKQYQKDYAASGKKKEAQSRYYQKHKLDICEKLKEKRKAKELIDDSVEITAMLGHKFK